MMDFFFSMWGLMTEPWSWRRRRRRRCSSWSNLLRRLQNQLLLSCAVYVETKLWQREWLPAEWNVGWKLFFFLFLFAWPIHDRNNESQKATTKQTTTTTTKKKSAKLNFHGTAASHPVIDSRLAWLVSLLENVMCWTCVYLLTSDTRLLLSESFPIGSRRECRWATGSNLTVQLSDSLWCTFKARRAESGHGRQCQLVPLRHSDRICTPSTSTTAMKKKGNNAHTDVHTIKFSIILTVTIRGRRTCR